VADEIGSEKGLWIRRPSLDAAVSGGRQECERRRVSQGGSDKAQASLIRATAGTGAGQPTALEQPA
jgi:hypothetical protein